MAEWLAVLAPIAAAVASVVGVLVAIDQLTLRARMRRIAEWSKELSEIEAAPEQLATLAMIRTWAVSQVVASVMVPLRHYVVDAATIAAAVLTIVRFPEGQSGALVISVLVCSLAILGLSFERLLSLHLERYRISLAYFRGQRVTPPDKNSLTGYIGSTTRAESICAWILGVSVGTAAIGVRLAAVEGHPLTGLLTLTAGVVFLSALVRVLAARTPTHLRA